jgi:hypothetical protein
MPSTSSGEDLICAGWSVWKPRPTPDFHVLRRDLSERTVASAGIVAVIPRANCRLADAEAFAHPPLAPASGGTPAIAIIIALTARRNADFVKFIAIEDLST